MRFLQLAPLAAMAALCFASPATAKGPRASDVQALNECVEAVAPKGDDLAIKDCYVALADAEDRRLNENWRTLMGAVAGTETEVGAALLAEQRAWIQFKDVSCRHYLMRGGTLNRLLSQMCYTQVITDRADYLAELTGEYKYL